MFKHILIPTDGSDLAGQAVERGIAFAAEAGADVTILTVSELFHIPGTDAVQIESTRVNYEANAIAFAKEILAAAEEKAKAAGVAVTTRHKWHDYPYEAIIDAALEDGCDLIAMASHGRRGVAAIVLGSQATKVLTHSKIPVLVYR